MAEAKEGDTVKIFYIGRFEDGTVFDHSPGTEPFQFKIGAGSMVQGFEEAVVGMAPGDVKTVTVPASKAYGPRIEDVVMEMSLSKIPPGLNPEIGDVLQIKLKSGRTANFIVTAITDSKVTLDANHPLAGRDLIFDLELMEICQGPSGSS